MQTPSQTQETSPADRSTEFVPVEGGQETTSAGALLVAAYLLMWALIFGFLWLTWRKNRKIDARLSALEAAVTKADQAQSS